MSKTPWSLEELLDLAPGYVFGGLNAQEHEAFEAGLRDPSFAAALTAEVTALREASDALVKAHAVTPPPSLRERMQARIAVESGTQHAAQIAGDVAKGDVMARVVTPTAAGASIPTTPAAPVSRATPTSRAVRVTPPRSAPAMDDLSRRRGSRAGWYATAVMAAGLAATAFFAVDLRNRVGVLEGEAREKSAQVSRLEAKLGEKERTLATLLAGRGNVVLVNLDATAPTGPGMQVFWNVREGRAVVNAYGLAQVAADRAYMLWMIRDGKPVPVKLFTPGEDGRALVADVELPSSTTGITLLAVTEESAQGAEAPTMTPFLAGAVGTK